MCPDAPVTFRLRLGFKSCQLCQHCQLTPDQAKKCSANAGTAARFMQKLAERPCSLMCTHASSSLPGLSHASRVCLFSPALPAHVTPFIFKNFTARSLAYGGSPAWPVSTCRWAGEQGLQSRLVPARFEGLRGLTPEADLEAGDTALSLPEGLLVSESTARASDLVSSLLLQWLSLTRTWAFRRLAWCGLTQAGMALSPAQLPLRQSSCTGRLSQKEKGCH